jgi:desulfoferrodoxin (superoxide reductase-like protein)
VLEKIAQSEKLNGGNKENTKNYQFSVGPHTKHSMTNNQFISFFCNLKSKNKVHEVHVIDLKAPKNISIKYIYLLKPKLLIHLGYESRK